MIDPASIVGLTIAIFDQLLKLGERSAELTSDIRAFSDDLRSLHDKIRYEDTRTKALRQLLFEPCSVYGGSTLFEQFDEDVQDQIKQSLGQLIGTLFQANQLLEHRYGSSSSSVSQGHQRSSSPSPASISGLSVTSTLYDQSSSVAAAAAQRRFSRSPFLLIRWSLRDKKHTENLLQEYSDLNGRIHEQIKLICLGSSIGLDLRHLHHLKTDDNSRKLGFDIDATLKLSIGESNIDATSLELTSPRWTDLLSAATSGQGSFMVLKDNDTFVLQESRFYAPLPQQTHDIDPRTRDRVEALARLLRQQKEQVFRIPRCIGWKFVPSLKHIAFLFEIPQGVTPKPVSLLQLLGDVDVKLSLGSKFHLALGLAKCMAQLHMVRWVHESFRSENVLFYPKTTSFGQHPPSNSVEVDYCEPWLLGFEYSRPELDFSSGFIDICPSRDVYRHPDRQGQPQKLFNKLHDIYALGVVLLEIGLWQPALALEKNHFSFAKDPQAIKARLVQQGSRRLESKMGRKYRDIVLQCLNGEFSVTEDTKEDLKLQQAFRSQVVDVLERAAEYI